MKKITAVLFIVALLAGCAKAPTIPLQEVHHYDKDTNFAIKEENDGFMLTVGYHLHKGFFPWGIGLKAAVTRECKSQFISIARALSDKTGRKIKPVNEENITIISEDNYCHAQYKVEWE